MKYNLTLQCFKNVTIILKCIELIFRINVLTGEFNQLLSDGSSPNTSAGNTPDSGDALDESTDSGVCGPASLPPSLTTSCIVTGSLNSGGSEKRSVRELAASLTKSNSQGKADKKENGKIRRSIRSVFFSNS